MIASADAPWAMSGSGRLTWAMPSTYHGNMTMFEECVPRGSGIEPFLTSNWKMATTPGKLLVVGLGFLLSKPSLTELAV